MLIEHLDYCFIVYFYPLNICGHLTTAVREEGAEAKGDGPEKFKDA